VIVVDELEDDELLLLDDELDELDDDEEELDIMPVIMSISIVSGCALIGIAIIVILIKKGVIGTSKAAARAGT